MPNRCVVAGCSNRSDPEKGISLHTFPKDPHLRMVWASRVKLTRSFWNGPTNNSVICSDHFAEGDFVPTSGLYAGFGLAMKPSLAPGAVPNTGMMTFLARTCKDELQTLLLLTLLTPSQSQTYSILKCPHYLKRLPLRKTKLID